MAEPTHKELTDVEKGTLIEEVRTKEAIWNASNADHSKRSTVDGLFEEIGTFMSTTERKITGQLKFVLIVYFWVLGKVVKAAWKNLKTSFNSYKTKQQNASGLSGEDAPKKWKFFDSIAAFLITVPTFAEPEYIVYFVL